jgi:hypothetical protein
MGWEVLTPLHLAGGFVAELDDNRAEGAPTRKDRNDDRIDDNQRNQTVPIRGRCPAQN